MKVLLVANPSAQSGRANERVNRVTQAMAARAWSVTLCTTEPGGATVTKVARALDAARDASEPFDVVVELGGDGTFREAAMGVLESSSRPPLGMLPSGTANDQGKSFGVSAAEAALEDNLDVIARRFLRDIDVGEIRRLDAHGAVTHETLFFDSAGFGMQAEVLHRRNVDRERIEQVPLLREVFRDHAVYAGALLKEYVDSFVNHPKLDAHVLVDGAVHEFTGVLDLIVKNTAVYGGAWVLERDNAPDDGRMELVPFGSRRDLVSKVIRDLKDLPVDPVGLDASLGLTHATGAKGARFDLTLMRAAEPEIASQLDGEEWISGRRFVVSVLPRALPLIVPKNFEPSWAKT
jgi:diacylglycerol kinase family enzyme